jgi:hypothetical protein
MDRLDCLDFFCVKTYIVDDIISHFHDVHPLTFSHKVIIHFSSTASKLHN